MTLVVRTVGGDIVYSGPWTYVSPVVDESPPPSNRQDATIVAWAQDADFWYFRVGLEATPLHSSGTNYIYGVYIDSKPGGGSAGASGSNWAVPTGNSIGGVDYILDSHSHETDPARWGETHVHVWGGGTFDRTDLTADHTSQVYNSYVDRGTSPPYLLEWKIERTLILDSSGQPAQQLDFWAGTLDDGSVGVYATRDNEGVYHTAPEPTTLLLALLLLLTGGWVRRRVRRR